VLAAEWLVGGSLPDLRDEAMSAYDKPYTERDGSQFQVYDGFTVEFREVSHRYWVHYDGKREPYTSVTTALDCIAKPALLRWSEEAGAVGAATLAWAGQLEGVSPAEVGELVRRHGLGMDAARTAAADRGISIHKVLELWLTQRRPPNVGEFPPEHQGFVAGLARWLLWANPKPTYVERFVASLKWQYAGRLDLRAEIRGQDCLVDLKTSRTGVPYAEAHAQARAYAMADVECGAPSPDRILIVGISETGEYTEVECCATELDWINVLTLYRTWTRLRNDVKLQTDVRKAAV
jgi:hypothetical protein